mmetsp:Transcript_55134/g.129432  ORF Transcript_55134/g.129432 Transcript_55134/m.129432 type:complete len:261 (-) Transcript_55134:25-807(-)
MVGQKIKMHRRLLLPYAVQLYSLFVVDEDVFPLGHREHVFIVEGLYCPYRLFHMQLRENVHRFEVHECDVTFDATNQHVLPITSHGAAVWAVGQIEGEALAGNANTGGFNDVILCQPHSFLTLLCFDKASLRSLQHLSLCQSKGRLLVRTVSLLHLTSKLLVFLRCDVFQGNISTSIPLYPLLQAFVRLHRLLEVFASSLSFALSPSSSTFGRFSVILAPFEALPSRVYWHLAIITVKSDNLLRRLQHLDGHILRHATSD